MIKLFERILQPMPEPSALEREAAVAPASRTADAVRPTSAAAFEIGKVGPFF
jgi:hypothetical protein